ncbi:MAG: FAD-dependent oxidoreductase [Bacteroidia bacterium]|nr:FAD-dependent oxidoreductase [Bacteroidia bacterium]MCX7652199.1 FAD-dependent oxidoreductase [Bacteroidia bacterium]MDW8416461.1 FAD-dependent oxidoreductase [Bacteroidia bacterium]
MQSSERRLIIIGAGSSGLGVALAAARRGWRVLILEARDIGGGTSTTSTKLIHGGVRYLESAIRSLRWSDWQLVREALRERKWVLNSHPLLCRPVPIVLPVVSGWERFYYGVGLRVYDYLSYPYRLGAPQWIGREAFYEYFPSVKSGINGGWMYWDGQFQDRLYAVHLALYLVQRFGVEVRTYHQVVDIQAGLKGVQVIIQSAKGEVYEETGDIVVNATGPWGDVLRRKLRPEVPSRIRVSRGSHLVLANLPELKAGFLIPRTADGRVLFILPWENHTWLVGTTDEEADAPTWDAEVPPREEEYLLTHLRRYFDVEGEVVARFAGFRPLVAADAQVSTARLARNHVIEVWREHKVIHLMGGKWTTFRAMGEDTMRAIYRHFLNLPMSEGMEVSQIVPDLSELERLKLEYPSPILPGEPYLEGEVIFWKRMGWAHTPDDIVKGRWQLHLINEKRAQRLKAALSEKWQELGQKSH